VPIGMPFFGLQASGPAESVGVPTEPLLETFCIQTLLNPASARYAPPGLKTT